MEKKMMNQYIVEGLSKKCLEDADIHFNYPDKYLADATLVFTHFLMDKLFTENQDLTLKGQMELAETTGKAIRELIKASTGKDMHKIVANSFKKKMNILKKIKKRYGEWEYNNWINSLNEQELTTHYTHIGYWNRNDKTRYNRTDWSDKGLNYNNNLCKKLDLMNQ